MPLQVLRACLGALVFLGALMPRPGGAVVVPDSFTLDLPVSAATTTPAWLGHPQLPLTSFAALDLPIQPADNTSFLLVTVYFKEKTGGFMRVIWQGASGTGSETLSDNFYEGVGMGNQRSLLVSPETMAGGGTLVFQCGDGTLGVDRVRFQWLVTQDGLVSPQIDDTMVTPSPGTTQPSLTYSGENVAPDPAAWRDHLVRVPVTEAPQRIEQGVEFSVELDSAPRAGRLALKVDGLPFGQHLVVWVNQHRAGTITPAVPDLSDDGYPHGAADYVGWRDGAVYLPASALKAGINTVQFSVEDDVTGTAPVQVDPSLPPPPLAVKDVDLQLDYPPLTPAVSPTTLSSPGPSIDAVDPDTNAAPTNLTPTGPLLPVPPAP